MCDLIDNCPASVNPNQQDLDGDGIGDVCDDTDATADVRRIFVYQSTRATDPNGRITIKGEIPLGPPPDVFTATAGIVVRVSDGMTLDQSFAWTATDCTTFASGSIKCESANGEWSGRYVPINGTAARLRFALSFTALDIRGPFNPKVTLQITDDPGVAVEGIDRFGTAEACTSTANDRMRCAEP